jgi:signal transduction histidine kinase
LTKRLITSSRISYDASTLEKATIDLKDFLHSKVKSFSSFAALRNVALRIRSESVVFVRGNSFLLSEIFGNLIENAILYSSQDGISEVVISWSVESKYVVVVISDLGPGLPSQVIDSLFKPFVRGDESEVSGSGLGLSTAKKSAELLGGDVVVQETGPTGTKIAIRLVGADEWR